MTRILLTGFEPFGGEDINPSWAAVSLLADDPGVTAVLLDCTFDSAAKQLLAAVERTDPDLVVCVGQAGGTVGIELERVAVNLDDARIPDNAGRQPVDEPIEPSGPAAYFSSLPVKECVAAVRAAGLPASVSNSAGTYVCNHIAYTLAHLIATERPTLRGGFVHVPYAPQQVPAGNQPSMAVADAANGLRAVVAAALA
ncbi:pyroglutamyl-peptidase I [Streptacidiphilus sp. N1-10]|uniref:Pyroglutamyl-peptidase I n=1 Tax=Streptacidiphilus jeojiensis TaxID=3229225 RepID=A0ABV6XJX2_9ACTN